MIHEASSGPAATTSMELEVNLRYEDFEQAAAEAERLLTERQRKAAVGRGTLWLTIMLSVAAGVTVLVVAPRLPGWDRYTAIRPPAYGALTVFVPMVVVVCGMLWVWGSALALRRTLPWLFLTVIAIAVILWAEVREASGNQTPPPDWLGTLLPHLPWALVIAVLAWHLGKARRDGRRRLWDLQSRLIRPRTVRIREDGVEVEEPDELRRYRWRALTRYSETRDLLLLWLSDISFEILPKRAFASEKHVETARRLFTQQITEAQHVPEAFEVVPVARTPKT